MLLKHLIAEVRPAANKENIVYWNNYRITVLGDRLFRIERSARKIFRDAATQAVWFRDAAPQKYALSEKDGKLFLKTEKCELLLAKRRSDCRIDIGGGYIPISNRGNLKGTCRTLDGCNGNVLGYPVYGSEYAVGERIRLENGVCSKSGVAVYDDARSLTLAENGEICAERGDGSDEYVFAFGNDYRGAVKALYGICGSVPMLPRYALGNWWSRYHKYTQREYQRMIDRFEEHEVPLTVATLDVDWHYSNAEEIRKKFKISENGLNDEKFLGKPDRGNAQKLGWTGYTFNTALFPDYKKLLSELAERGLKVTLNIHPGQGIRFWEDCYVRMAESIGKDPKAKEVISFDMTDTRFINGYFSVINAPYEKDGVAFWWIDWQQGKNSKIEGLDPLWSINHYYSLDSAKGGEAPLILSRYAGIGSHRYPVGFSGDCAITWKTLAYLPFFTATAANVGYAWWSHDIGGHNCGVKDDELYVRFLQFGIFSPVNRLHCTNSPVMTKEPWMYKNGTGKIAEEMLRLRHRLIPFLYSAAYRCHSEGRVPVEPLYYEWNESEAYSTKNEYIFGGELLVAPIVKPAGRGGYAQREVWIPEGKWTDIFTGDVYIEGKGGRKRILTRSLDSIPVLAKSGAVIPLATEKGNGTENPALLEVWVFEGSGSFTLYERGEKGTEAFTRFSAEYTERDGCGTQTLFIRTEGDAGVFPSDRKLRVVFRNAAEGSVSVAADGRETDCEMPVSDQLTAEFSLSGEREFTVTAKYSVSSEAAVRTARACKILTAAQGANDRKEIAYNAIAETVTESGYIQAVDEADLPAAVKMRLKENLPLYRGAEI